MTTPRHPITGPCAWHGSDLAANDDWITPLPKAAADEIEAALDGVSGLAWRDIERQDFPLPELSKTLAEAAHELEHGRGFVRLRGLPVERYGEDDLRKIFWGIGAHLGATRYQNARGEIMGEVRDELRAFGEVRESHPSGVDGRAVSSRYKTRTNGARAEGVLEQDRVVCQAIDVGTRRSVVPIAPQGVRAQDVDQNE